MTFLNKEKIYYILPYKLQNFLISVYGKYLYTKRYSSPFFDLLKEIEKSEKLSFEECNELQFQRLVTMLKYISINVPFYKKHFKILNFTISDIKSLKDLSCIPVLEKDQLRANAELFISNSTEDKAYFSQNTSGSSGKPLTVYVNEETYKLAMALILRHEQKNGVKLGEPRATFAGRMIKKISDNSPPFSRFNKAENQMLFSAYHISRKNIIHYIKELNQFSPLEIIGYPSAIFTLAFEILKSNLTLTFKPNVIVTNSETLLEWQRETIENAFSCPVRDYYGTAEYVIFTSQCEFYNYHINPLLGILEVVNEYDEAVIDQEGEVVCTTLVNKTMPLIRYKIGDRAVMGSRPCQCGSELPYLSKVLGRIDDFVQTLDGRNIGRLDHIFKNLSNIKEGQIIQAKSDRCILKIVKGDINREVDEQALIGNFKERVGEEMGVNIEYVDEIKKGKNGKFKAVVNRLNKQ